MKRFHCLGPVTGSSKQFHQNGFVKNSAINVENSEFEILLFGKEYLFQTALPLHGDVLFDTCR